MNSRRLVLLFISIFIVIIFFRLGPYKDWLNDRILVFQTEIHDDIDRMDLEKRREYRWGGPYIGIKTIAKYVDTLTGSKKPTIILLPPPAYVKTMGNNVMIPEPVIVYYYSGIRATTIDCKDLYTATGCILGQNGQTVYQQLNTKEEIDEIVKLYKSAK